MKTLNEWMDSNGITPEQAAEIFGKSVGTIRNWRSAGIPANQREWVEKRMVDWSGKPLPELPDRVTLEVTAAQFDEWNRAALAEGKILRQWAIEALDQAAADDDQTGADEPLYPLPSVPALRVAESAPLDRSKLDAIYRGGAEARAEKLRRQLQAPAPQRKEPANGEAEAEATK